MMEFFLSKFWAIMCGLMLMGVVTASIMDLTTASTNRIESSTIEEMAAEITSFCNGEGGAKVTLFADDFLPRDDDTFIFRNGSVQLLGSGHSSMSEVPGIIMVLDGSGVSIGTGYLQVGSGSSIVLEKTMVRQEVRYSLHEEKARTTFLTAWTNLSHSSLSL